MQPTHDHQVAAAEQMWIDKGQIPPWWKVYDDGVDVTDDDPNAWPEVYKNAVAQGWWPPHRSRPDDE